MRLGLDIDDIEWRRLLDAFVSASFMVRSDAADDPRVVAMQQWSGWNPAAGFFHTASRLCTYGDGYSFDLRLKDKAVREGTPPPVKPASAQRISLPLSKEGSRLDEVLAGRRTWRRFGRRPVKQDDLAAVLRAALGITHWVCVPGVGDVPLTTSPSGGSRHPLEGYVAVLNVDTVAPGLYRYAPDRHELDVVRTGLTVADVETLIPTQPWFAQAAFVLFLTAVFERTRWKYNFPRAYRAVLLEAGHVCQTFLLSATDHSLAPFCTMALDDARVEGLLGIDGISEAVLYAAGAGARPKARARVDLPGAGRAQVRRHAVTKARALALERTS